MPCDLATALPLFTPEGERAWVDGWAPRYLSGATDEVGAVWQTSHGDEVICITTDRDQDRVRYARVSSSGTAGLVEVRCTPTDAGTNVQVTYDLTARTDAGLVALDQFATHFDDMLDHWQQATTSTLVGTPVITRADDHSPTSAPNGR